MITPGLSPKTSGACPEYLRAIVSTEALSRTGKQEISAEVKKALNLTK